MPSAVRAFAVLVALVAAGTARAADLEAGKAKAVETCAACHGPNGISENENVPSIAGQPDQFTQWQLVYFRAGTRKNEPMQPFVEKLTDADIRNLGAYYASLAPPPPADSADDDPGLTERGAKLAERHRCANCHKDDYKGDQATARLIGQRRDYLLKALRDFKSGLRAGGGVAAMPSAVYPLTDDELVALAQFLSRLR